MIEFSDMNDEIKKRSQFLKNVYRLYNPRTGKTMYPYHKMNAVAADAVVCNNVIKIVTIKNVSHIIMCSTCKEIMKELSLRFALH